MSVSSRINKTYYIREMIWGTANNFEDMFESCGKTLFVSLTTLHAKLVKKFSSSLYKHLHLLNSLKYQTLYLTQRLQSYINFLILYYILYLISYLISYINFLYQSPH